MKRTKTSRKLLQALRELKLQRNCKTPVQSAETYDYELIEEVLMNNGAY